MEQQQDTLDTQTQPAQYVQGILLVIMTVFKTARTTALALLHEHPYALLFLLVFGVFLFPLSTTAIIGTLFLIFTAGSTIFISVVFFAPALAALTFLAFVVWIASILMLGFYRYVWNPEQRQYTVSKHRSTRWHSFRSTLQQSEGTRGQRDILEAISTSTPDGTRRVNQSSSLVPLNLDNKEDGKRIKRRSFPVNSGVIISPEQSAAGNAPPAAAAAPPEVVSDFLPRVLPTAIVDIGENFPLVSEPSVHNGN